MAAPICISINRVGECPFLPSTTTFIIGRFLDVGHSDQCEAIPDCCFEGLSWWHSGQESVCQCMRHGFDPWVGKLPWRRKRQCTTACLPGKSCGQRSLVGYSPWGCKKSNTTEPLTHILPQTPLPSRLPRNIEQSSLCYTVGPCWLFT